MWIYVNNNKIEINSNLNIIQACDLNNIYIPRFCYHDKLSIAGNCRMCLIELKGVIKPVASCALPVAPDLQIYTNSKIVKKSREGILEFILINHPLDCPICDQGGECDLQDQSLLYGNDKGRFYDLKRSVKDKYCGPLIKTIMTRCIQCTRCTRFINEIGGLNILGVIGRGNLMEISNFLEKSIISELSGNLIDICPVGALTSKPYSFLARPWELNSINTIDLNDIIHVNIRVDIRDTKILRILPNYNLLLKEDWISDFTRFSYDGFFNNRLTKPLIKRLGKLYTSSWLNVLNNFKKLDFRKINFLLGDFIDIETALIVKTICNKYGNYSINIVKKNYLNNDFRSNFLFNEFFYNNLNSFDQVLLFNTNLRLENPLLNLRLKKLSDKNLIKVISLGSSFGYNFFCYNFNNAYKYFKDFLEGKNFLSTLFLKSDKSLLIFNWNFFLKKKNFNLFLLINSVLFFIKKKIFYSFVNIDTTTIIANEINLLNSINTFQDFSLMFNTYIDNNLFYFINTENFTCSNKNLTKNNFFILQSFYMNFNSNLFKNINMFLPSAHYIEKNTNYINFYGLIQKTNFILLKFKDIRLDFNILYIFFKKILKKKINKSIFTKYNIFLNFKYTFIIPFSNKHLTYFFSFNNLICKTFLTNAYKSNILLKRSLNMIKCYFELKHNYSNFI